MFSLARASSFFLCFIIGLETHFMSPVFFYTPKKQKTRGILMFSGGVEWVDKAKKKKKYLRR